MTGHDLRKEVLGYTTLPYTWHSSTYVRHPPTLERMTTSSESGRVFILDKWTEVTQSVTEKQKGSFEKREKTNDDSIASVEWQSVKRKTPKRE